MRPLSGSLLPCLLFFATTVLAIFKDDAFHTDWHMPLIGPSLVTSTFFHRPSPDSRASLIYTLTHRSILAAINPKDGQLVWRQSLADGPLAAGNGVARGGDGIIVAAAGTSISSFDAGNGRLVWENEFSKRAIDLRVTSDNAVAVLFEDGAVSMLDKQTGDVTWQWKGLDGSEVPISLHLTDSTVIVTSLQGARKLHLISISLLTGESSSSITSVAVSADTPSTINSAESLLSWTEDDLKTLKLLPLGAKSSVISVPVPRDVLEVNVKALKNIALVQYKTADKSWADLYKVDYVKSTAKKVYSLEPLGGVHSAFSLSVFTDKIYVVWTLPSGETALYGVDSPKELASYSLPKNLDIDVLGAISEAVPRPDGTSFAVRTFLSSSSPGFVGNTHLIRNGELAWTRKESLASIVASSWVELLDPTTEEIVGELDVETHTSLGAAYLHRVRRHVHELQLYGPDWVKALPHRVSNAFLNKDTTEERTGKWRDFFGFRKFAIVVTQDGGLAAIDVGRQGEVVWEASLLSGDPQLFQGVSGIRQVRKGTVGIVLTSGEYLEYNGFGGTLLNRVKLSAVVRATAVLGETALDTSIVALLEDGKAVVLPLDAATREQPVYLATKESPRSVRGLQISTSHVPINTWTFIPPAGEEITSVSSRPVHDPVASVGRVLGDRSVMYKYINPHLLTISTVNPTLSTATIYLLDSVSGIVLHSSMYPGVDTSYPITATISGNWIVYTYFGDDDLLSSSAAKGYHLVVAELYESPIRNDRGALSPQQNVSSFDDPSTPHVIAQSYIFPSAIKSLATTSTKQGITAHEILVLLPGTNGIYSIPKRVLDPRRPIGRDPDAAEKEEGLFRYAPTVEIDPKMMITHERRVMGLERVVTTPSQLESTSIVFAYGGDLFGTRVAPSMAFDILGKGFNKVQLVLTVVALGIGAGVVAPMVRRKQINSRWLAA